MKLHSNIQVDLRIIEFSESSSNTLADSIPHAKRDVLEGPEAYCCKKAEWLKQHDVDKQAGDEELIVDCE